MLRGGTSRRSRRTGGRRRWCSSRSRSSTTRRSGENIEFAMKMKGVAPDLRKARALELLRLVRLPESYYTRATTQCSGGERQRVALARAFASDPEILFFDEPLSAIDYRLRKTLEVELKELHQRTGQDLRLHHPQPRGGDGDVGPHRDHAVGAHHPDRHAVGDLSPPGQPLRGELHGRGEHPRGGARPPR